MMCLLPGLTEIKVNTGVEKLDGCGLIPLGNNVNKICTEGLKWNLGDYKS